MRVGLEEVESVEHLVAVLFDDAWTSGTLLNQLSLRRLPKLRSIRKQRTLALLILQIVQLLQLSVICLYMRNRIIKINGGQIHGLKNPGLHLNIWLLFVLDTGSVIHIEEYGLRIIQIVVFVWTVVLRCRLVVVLFL